jgi:small ligand-binding sensory domain FIST
VVPFPLDQEDLETLAEAQPEAWHDRIGVTPADKPSFIILPDASSVDITACLSNMDAVFPGSTIVGGVASGSQASGKNQLFLGENCLRRGLVGVSLSGPVQIDAVVSQGCRPVGEPFVVTKVRDNLIVELGGKPALSVLREIFNQASSADQVLMQNGLHVGRLIDEQQRAGETGAYLVRNMIGITQSEALAIGDFFRPGQTVQFHVRDARTADEEMTRLLEEDRQRNELAPEGALLFTCNGRGQRFFKKPNHDIGLVNSIVGDCPTAGFFAGGEIGPIGGRSFIHGFTSSLVLFRSAL